ncbi:MAG: Ig-like domain-containing protein [Bacteroidales bacterium]|nr:Ig-like domain-containing protein [Candidatus Colimorpha merdihippi]
MRTKHSLWLVAALLVAACAKEGFPSGGPKDETPPVALDAQPKNGTLNFDAKEIVINFDEYVTVRDAENNILVSPPMKHKPEYGTKGRGILVKIKDTLHANTTYLFQFKEGIADYNEGNVLASYEYVFSTGNSIDSMSIRGQVVDAYTHKASSDVITVVAFSAQQVEAFDSLQRLSDTLGGQFCCADSIVSKQQPMYMTRCDKEGHFELNHVRQGQYLLLAMNDGDKNLKLNTGEAMAFLDTMVSAQHMPVTAAAVRMDTDATDTAAAADTTLALAAGGIHDSVVATTEAYPPIVPVTMHLSLMKQERQRVTKAEFRGKGNIEIVTMCPLSSRYTLSHLDTNETTELFIAANRKNDTLQVWTANRSCDSITLVIRDTDFADTLRLHFQTKPSAKNNSAMQNAKPASMRSLAAGSHPYFDTLKVAFLYPMDSVATIDTLPLPVSVMALADSTTTYCALKMAANCTPRASSWGYIDFQGKAGQKYQITIPEGCTRDVYGRLNADALTFTTEYTKAETYGNISVQLMLPDTTASYIVQLINEKGDAIRQQVVVRTGKVTFLHLKAGKYSFRAIADINGDGQWTAGDYYSHRQPEPVYYFEKVLDLRENWDMDEKWEIK